jgi:threonine dehydrogenase-like Zn-dependent dehydrogenase
MRAIQFCGPRKIKMLTDAPIPEPKDGEVQIKSTFVGMCGSNMGHYTGEGFYGREYPVKIANAGHENIGIISKSRHPEWKEGMLVLGQPEGYFGFAEYFVCRPPAISLLPQDAADPCSLIIAQPLSTVLRALSRIQDTVINKTCAVIGQGSMGLIFTHTLRLFGARKVIAVDPLAWRLEWSKRFSADGIVDSSKQNAVEAVKELTKGDLCEFVVDAAGTEASLQTAAYCARKYGRLLMFGMPHFDMQQFPWYHTFRANVQVNTCVGPECGDFFQTATDMVLDFRASALTAMVTPRMHWDRAAEAFEMYADHAKDAIKVTLEL